MMNDECRIRREHGSAPFPDPAFYIHHSAFGDYGVTEVTLRVVGSQW